MNTRFDKHLVLAGVLLVSTSCCSCSSGDPDLASTPVGADAAVAEGGDAQVPETGDSAATDEASQQEAAPSGAFTLTSTVFTNGGKLPVDYTCDGAENSPPLAWSGVPAGTVELALLMTTLAPDELKWNWVLYHIPASVSSLEENTTGIGAAGLSSDGPELRYYAPCSSGPGDKTYTFTLYALSGAPSFSVAPNQVNGQMVTDAIGPLTIASTKIDVSYARQGL